MVEIRTLRPLVRIRMPPRPVNKAPGRAAFKVVVRHNRDYPPPTPQPTPCRLWQGAEGTDGYGRRKVRDADGSLRSSSMHRWVMEQMLDRRLKPSEVVLHACDNRLCYRADHLSVGTVQDNNRDMLEKGRNSPPPVNVFHGECHPMAKLSAHQVRRIRGHYQSGLKATTIAQMFDVSPSTIRRIVKGVRWAQFGKEEWGSGTGGQIIRPPGRDLLAEAQARIDAAAAAEAAKSTYASSPPSVTTKRIRPVKKMNIRSMERTDDQDL